MRLLLGFILVLLFVPNLGVCQKNEDTKRAHSFTQVGLGLGLNHSSPDANTVKTRLTDFKIGTGIRVNLNDNWRMGSVLEFNKLFNAYQILYQ